MAIKGIHKEGKGTIIFATVLTIAIAVPTYLYLPFIWLQAIIAAALVVFNYLVWQFFRVPVRNFLTDDNTVVCPSDGKVVVIENTHEKEFLKEDCQMVSIFMSPLNVHINWFPIAGKVIYTKYHKGKFLVAFNPKSSELNERNTVAVENKDGHKVLVPTNCWCRSAKNLLVHQRRRLLPSKVSSLGSLNSDLVWTSSYQNLRK